MRSKVRSDNSTAPERRESLKRGNFAELAAAAYLLGHGHRILARRYKTPLGEIDLITLKGRRIGFVEVKYRPDHEACQAAITSKLRQRVRNASDLWFAKQKRYHGYDVGFDLVFITPWARPAYIQNAL